MPAGVRQLQARDLGDGSGAPVEVLEVDPGVLDGEIGGEEEGSVAHGDPAGGEWAWLAPVARSVCQASPTLDEYTGDVLLEKLVAAAKMEEVQAMESAWDVWDVVPVDEAWKVAGRKPIGGRQG